MTARHNCVFVAFIWCAALSAVGGSVTLSFQLWMPNSTYPSLGESWQGQLTYGTTPNGELPFLGFPSNGYPLLSMSGTRTVWTSSPQFNTTYNLNSTANILGLVPASKNQYWWVNSSITLAPGVQQVQVSPLGPTSITTYGTLQIIQWRNLTNYTRFDGFQYYPLVDIVYDNVFYPQSQVADCMDEAGWMVQLDRIQPGMINITGNPGFAQYTYTVNLYSGNNQPNVGGDLSDWDGNQEWGVDLIPFGFNGNLSVQAIPSPTNHAEANRVVWLLNCACSVVAMLVLVLA